jgi:hypothetical protein
MVFPYILKNIAVIMQNASQRGIFHIQTSILPLRKAFSMSKQALCLSKRYFVYSNKHFASLRGIFHIPTNKIPLKEAFSISKQAFCLFERHFAHS